jgi:hypothetical protein
MGRLGGLRLDPGGVPEAIRNRNVMYEALAVGRSAEGIAGRDRGAIRAILGEAVGAMRPAIAGGIPVVQCLRVIPATC